MKYTVYTPRIHTPHVHTVMYTPASNNRASEIYILLLFPENAPLMALSGAEWLSKQWKRCGNIDAHRYIECTWSQNNLSVPGKT